MSPLRRCIALLFGLLLPQLALLRDPSCDSHATVTAHAQPAAHAVHDASPVPSPPDGCDAEGVPSGCTSMPSCVQMAVIPASVVVRVTSPTVDVALPEPAAVLSHSVAAPDVPPPRG